LLTPDIPGIDRDNIVNLEDVLKRRVRVGNRAVVIGGGLTGCETSLFLVEMGSIVTIVDVLDEIATGLNIWYRSELMAELTNKRVVSLVGVKCEEVTSKGLVITTKEGRRQCLEADTIVLAAGSKPNNKLYHDLCGKVSQLYLAGDASDPRRILEAVADGSSIACEL
ncbi:FAD-dependent oxidoreductase, partial [Chloroflexota bacterium]